MSRLLEVASREQKLTSPSVQTVPATAITTFCFLGFLQIGNEIENVS